MSGAAELKRAVELSLAHAKRAGASEAAAAATQAQDAELSWRDGKVEKLEQATTRSLSVQLYVDGRYGALSTSDLRPDALAKLIQDSVALTRALAPDPQRALPDPALYANRSNAALELEDASHAQLTQESRLALARELEAAARAVPGAQRFNSVTTNVSDVRSFTFRAHSNGFEGARTETSFSLSADASITDSDGRRPGGGTWATRRFLSDLPSATQLGRMAAEKTLSRLGAVKGPSAVLTAVVENRAAGTLVNHLLAPLYAQQLQQRRSCLDGKLGAVIGSAALDVRDDPFRVRGLGSRHFDSEGISARPLPLFEGGVLRTYYVDNYYGRKLRLAPTTAKPSNLSWKPGTRGLDALIAQAGDGLLITGFLGGNSNSTSGDFSLGVEGFRIRAGTLAEPLSEMNLSGNHLAFWKHLVEVGNDPWESSTLRTPSLVFEAAQLAGA